MLLQVLVKHNRQTDTNQGPVKGRADVHTAKTTSTGSDNGNGISRSESGSGGRSDGGSRSNSSMGTAAVAKACHGYTVGRLFAHRT